MPDMIWTDEQYRRVARCLDGEDLALSQAELALAEEIRADERRMSAALEAGMSGELLVQADQHALAEEVRRDQAALAGLLDADVPRQTTDRAYRRAVAALARPQRLLMRIGAAGAAVAAVAAAVLLTVALNSAQPSPHGKAGELARTPGRAPPRVPALARAPIWAVPLEVLTASMQEPRDAAVEMVAQEIDELEADMLAAAVPTPEDVGMDHLQRAVEEFWMDEVFE